MIKLLVVALATGREDYAQSADELYLAKLKHFIPAEIQFIKSPTGARDQAEVKRRQEGDKLLDFIQADDYVCVFDEKGRLPKDSLDFAKTFVQAVESGKQRLLVIIGGAYGIDKRVKERAQLILSLSPLTLNHHVARVTILEQIYRAFTIWKNLPYHNS